MKAAWVNSMQMLPSTTETDSGVTVKGAKVTRSADSKKLIFISTFPASFIPMVESADMAWIWSSVKRASRSATTVS